MEEPNPRMKDIALKIQDFCFKKVDGASLPGDVALILIVTSTDWENWHLIFDKNLLCKP
jgi:hypothetical protein